MPVEGDQTAHSLRSLLLACTQSIDKTDFGAMMKALRERSSRGGHGGTGTLPSNGQSRTAVAVAEAEARMMAPLFDKQTASSAKGRLSHTDFDAWIGRLNAALSQLEFAHYARSSRGSQANAAASGQQAASMTMTQSEFATAVVDSLKAAGRQDVAEYEDRYVQQALAL